MINKWMLEKIIKNNKQLYISNNDIFNRQSQRQEMNLAVRREQFPF